MINKIDFNAKKLTSNAGLFLLLENAKSNGIFDLIENDLVFDNDSTNKINRNFPFVKMASPPLFVGFFNESYKDDALRSFYWH
jgi:hypothetical protein